MALSTRFFTAATLLVVCGASVCYSDGTAKKDDEKPAAKSVEKGARSVGKISAERESAILAFVQQNHAEMVPLLEGVKQRVGKEYEAALIDLDRSIGRLEKVKENMPARYEHQLAEWKLNSQIRLLAARLSVSEDDSIEMELHTAVQERLDLRLTNQRAERDRLQKRLAKLNESIDEMSDKREAIIEKEMKQLKSAKSVSKAVHKKQSKRPTTPTQADEQGKK